MYQQETIISRIRSGYFTPSGLGLILRLLHRKGAKDAKGNISFIHINSCLPTKIAYKINITHYERYITHFESYPLNARHILHSLLLFKLTQFIDNFHVFMIGLDSFFFELIYPPVFPSSTATH